MDGELAKTCCKYGGWTLAIGIIKIVGCVIREIAWIYFCGLNPTEETNDRKNKVLAVSTLQIYIVMNFIMGIVLVVGTTQGIIGNLTAWVIYNIVFVVLWGILALLELILVTLKSKGCVDAFGEIVRIAVYIAIEAVFVWLVDLHKAELLALAGTDGVGKI